MLESNQPALNRRELLQLGAGAAVVGALGAAGTSADPTGDGLTPAGFNLRTGLCDLLGIRHPILQAPMARVVTPEMIAAVARAGGLGFYPATGMAPSDLRQHIRRIKELTESAYGVNLILHPSVRTPVQPDQIRGDTMQAIQRVLNGFRDRLGLPHGPSQAPRVPAITDEAFDVILEERVPVFGVGVGRPTAEMVARCHAQGTKVVSMVSTVPDAREVAALGVDAIIAQGGEAGGHRSTWIKRESPEMAAIGTMALVPQVVGAVKVPVIAAGGIVSGRQLVAALALGASGVLMGTRFIATRESAAPEFYKRAIVAGDGDQTTITDAFTGLYARMIRNPFTEEYRASGAPVVPAVQQAITADVAMASAERGSGDFYPMYAGQGIGMIEDLPGAASVVQAAVAEAERTLAELTSRVRSA